MRFVLRMAARETRASWQRLLFFFVCIAVGVAAIVALRSVIQSVREVFGREAKSLISADLLVSTTQDWTPVFRQALDRELADVGSEHTETLETPTMVRPADASKPVARMVELKAIQAPFPYYGQIELAGDATYSHALLQHHGVLVRPELLTALGVRMGESIVIGQAMFRINGVIAREPGRDIGGFSLGPRILIDYDDVPSTGLLAFGSRARRSVLVKVADDKLDGLARRIRRDVKDEQPNLNVRSYKTSDDQIGRDFDRAEDYLSLVGLIIVILGGIAVSSVVRVFIQQKIRSIAVLKCVGARSAQIVAVYLLQVMVLGIAGSLFGVALAAAAVGAIPAALANSSSAASILADAHYVVSASAALQGVVIGALVSLLFSIVPLLQVRLVKPSLLLRDEPLARVRDWTRMAAMVGVSLALVGVAVWQAGSVRIGVIVCVGFAVLAFILQLAGRGLVLLLAPLARSRSFPLRHGVLHLSRPGNQTRVILLAVGLGAFFIVGVRSLQASLLDEFTLRVGDEASDMFLLDIQRTQADGVRAFLADASHGVHASAFIPVLRAHVVAVDGRDTKATSAEDIRRFRRGLMREFTVTYRDHLEPNEKVVAGAFPTTSSPDAEVSIEKGMRERNFINVGDTMDFDILGRVVHAKVTSVRDVEWRDARNGGFVFVFRPGVLDNAPQTFVAPLKGPEDVAARARFQHDLSERFPNVSVIDLHEILQAIRDVMSKITFAITVVGGLVLFSGVLILVGAVAMTKFQRVYEAAIFKTLGANSRTIGRMLLFEYGVLGSVAGLIGSLGAVALTWGVSRYALDIPWRIDTSEHVGGVVFTAILVGVIGVVSSLDVLRNKPLATLRSE